MFIIFINFRLSKNVAMSKRIKITDFKPDDKVISGNARQEVISTNSTSDLFTMVI